MRCIKSISFIRKEFGGLILFSIQMIDTRPVILAEKIEDIYIVYSSTLPRDL